MFICLSNWVYPIGSVLMTSICWHTGWKVASGAAKVLAADITGDSSALPDTFETSMLSPEGRIKYSPWFCRLVDLFTYNY